MTSLEQLTHAIQTARRMTLGLLEGLRSVHWLHQPVHGGQHAAWIVGHLAIADDWGLVALGMERTLTELDPCFDASRPITADAAAYPTPEMLRPHFDAAHQRLIDRLRRIDASDLHRPTSGPIAQFAPDLGTLLVSHAWHEGFHGGQLALIRRSLDLPIRWG